MRVISVTRSPLACCLCGLCCLARSAAITKQVIITFKRIMEGFNLGEERDPRNYGKMGPPNVYAFLDDLTKDTNTTKNSLYLSNRQPELPKLEI